MKGTMNQTKAGSYKGKMNTIGFIGTGAMGGALIKGIRKNNESVKMMIYDKDTIKMNEVATQYHTNVAKNEADLVIQSDIVFLAVKPQHMQSVLTGIAAHASAETLFITLAVGIPLAFYQEILGKEAKIIRTMPNTPALVGKGFTFFCGSLNITAKDKETAKELLNNVGMVEEIEEKYMNEVTAVTGSSPAYFFIMLEAMADAAVLSGLPRASAYRWAASAMSGSAELVLQTGKHPAELKDMVTSPAGTTIEGVAVLERKGFRSAVIDAMDAVTKKSRSIGKT